MVTPDMLQQMPEGGQVPQMAQMMPQGQNQQLQVGQGAVPMEGMGMAQGMMGGTGEAMSAHQKQQQQIIQQMMMQMKGMTGTMFPPAPKKDEDKK